jgi:hypothetical protein
VDLERISVTVRLRSAWEAIDLGFAMARRWWRTSMAGLLLLAAPIFIIGCALSLVEPWLGIALAWWLKPVFERFPLEVVSREFFGEHGSAVRVLARIRWPTLGELVAALTWRRLAPWRSYFAPIEQLESLTGPAARRRVMVLGRAHRGHAVALTALMFVAEASLYVSFYAFVELLSSGADWAPEIPAYDEPGWDVVLSNALALGAQLVLMPFYAAAGFSLYIKRRIDLEGWDLELAFRRLARRVESEAARRLEAAS